MVRGPGGGHVADGRGAGGLPAGRVARWWLPERWAFVDEIPKTSVGKFDKKVLRSRYADGQFDVVTVDFPPAGECLIVSA